ncbi:MAG: DUF5906 domain-containing protein [Rhizomicrobium sp.]|nr:DUF5906 domain-containing protein [Rhizomicrobium sp.]
MKGDDKKESASKRWMRSPERRTYCDGVTFMPSGNVSNDTLNLWRGWAVSPDPSASCKLLVAHVRDVICSGNAGYAKFVLGWLADLVQHPDKKPGVAMVLKGGKGVGKDTLGEYVARMIGRRHAPTVSQSAHITGRFNSRLSAALLLHIQEGIWAGDKEDESVLKYLITSSTVEIERKGIDSTSEPSFFRIFMTANADWVVPASEDERRFAVFEVSSTRRGDRKYFDALHAEMENGGPAALLHFLQEYDLSNFDVHDVPATEGLCNQKLATLKDIQAWWYDRLTVGIPPNGSDAQCWFSEIQISREALRRDYMDWRLSQKHQSNPLDEARFGRAMREMVPSLKSRRPRDNGSRSWQYTFPPLAVCRPEFEAKLGSTIKWED